MAEMEKDTLSDALKSLEPYEQARLIPQRPVYVSYRGSLAHGTHVPSYNQDSIDDVDIMAVYIPGLEHYFGLPTPSAGRQIQMKEWDCAAYELRHFVSLLANANPDVLQSLWVRPEDRILVTREAAELLNYRHLFSSKQAYHSFGGYARGQLKRMTAFHESGEATCCSGEQYHEPDCRLTQERGRGSAKKFATGFMGAKRKALVEKFGYDCKNAAHLIRLVRMGREFLISGELNVYRGDMDSYQLIEIKTGQWTLKQVLEMADIEFALLEQASVDSKLPEKADVNNINRLLTEVLSLAKAAEVTLNMNHVVRGRPTVYA